MGEILKAEKRKRGNTTSLVGLGSGVPGRIFFLWSKAFMEKVRKRSKWGLDGTVGHGRIKTLVLNSKQKALKLVGRSKPESEQESKDAQKIKP